MSARTTQHFTPRATLAALGTKIRSLKLFDTIAVHVQIKQKTIKHTPLEKLQDAFIAILAGAHGLVEINTRLRSDEALQRAFGRTSCAEQSVVQETLDACTPTNVIEMQRAIDDIFRQHSRAFRHPYRRELQLLDIDITGLPCGPKAALSTKGYFANDGIRYGRQLGRVVATHYKEIVIDRLCAGSVQLTKALRPLVEGAEQTLELTEAKRARTILRIDAGGGALDDVNWCLSRGYQLHGKDFASTRAAAWAATVKEWFDDPQHEGRQLGWADPETTPDYVRPVRRLVIRWHKRNGHSGHAMLISTLEAREVLGLLGQPLAHIDEPAVVALAYAEFYDKRGGAVEIEIKEDKQGCGMTKRRKKRAEAQQMVVFLNSLAHNVLVWARSWLSETQPKLARFGALRMVRDLFQMSGIVEWYTTTKRLKRIILNRAAPHSTMMSKALRNLLLPEHVVLILGET
ncbi:MAG: transposase [Acidobacteriota bacterium]|nr:transposase [Acidobacteriota bacterium]